MSNFTHVICDDCWWERNPDREPYRLKASPLCRCCYCGGVTNDGIFVRENPETALCGGKGAYHEMNDDSREGGLS